MTEASLRTSLWIAAHVRICDRALRPAVVARKGDANAGAVLVKVIRYGVGCTVFSQARTADGAAAWLRGTGAAPVAEADADAYVARQVRFDPDLWVLEIEDRDGQYVPPGPVL